MQDVLTTLTPTDYRFLVEVIEGPVNLTSDYKLRTLLEKVERDDNEAHRATLSRQLEHELRYLGSADFAYAIRYLTSKEPGVSVQEVIRDVAKKLKVEISELGTAREMLQQLVERYATKQFAHLSPQEQQELLVSLGVDRDRAASFLKKSAGIFALPALIEAFGIIVVDGLIKTVIFGTIGKIIGAQLAARLFQMLVSRLPWWVGWIGPAAWSLSIGWAVVDIQGPAYRKTIPAMLYLGLCVLREREQDRPAS